MNEQETRESQLQGAAALVAGLHLRVLESSYHCHSVEEHECTKND